MQTCPHCDQVNPVDTSVCIRCGISLRLSPDDATKNLADRIPRATEEIILTPEDRVIRLEFRDHVEPLIIQLDEQALLGRQGGEASKSSFINFEPYNASDYGVSRRHAMFSWQDFQLMLCDLGSTNHTYLNGIRLREKHDYPLRSGDEIALGKLVFKLYF